MSYYTMLSKYGNCTCLLKIKKQALVGYEMIIANEARKSQLGATRTRGKQSTPFIADIVWTLS